jgi:glutamine phosphoribosylpyrophosphate amidotransferase
MLFDGLTVLQHRGQDAAGIVTSENRRLHLRKDNGLVKDVFRTHHMMDLRGNIGLGHVRYPTAGSSSCAEAQPLYTNYPYGICVAHNGNITNTQELTEQLREKRVSANGMAVLLCLSLSHTHTHTHTHIVLTLTHSLAILRDILIPIRIRNFFSISLPIISRSRMMVATWSKRFLRPWEKS